MAPGSDLGFGLSALKEEEVVPRWREYRSPENPFGNQPFQTVSDAQRIATIRNLPAAKEVSFGVTNDRYRSFLQLLRPGVLHATIYDLDNRDKNDNAYAGVYLGKVLPAKDSPSL